MARAATGNNGDWVERRRHPRHRVLKGGIIAFSNRQAAMRCMVRDFSEGGARLKFDGMVGVPEHFDLLIELDGLEAECQVRWRKGQELGVEFLETHHVSPRRQQAIAPLGPAVRKM